MPAATPSIAPATLPVDAVLDFARSLEDDGDTYRAITEYKRAAFVLGKAPAAIPVLGRIAALYADAGKWLAAGEAYARLAKAFPDAPDGVEAQRRAGEALVKASRFGAGRRWLDGYLARVPHRTDAAWTATWAALKAQDWSDADRRLEGLAGGSEATLAGEVRARLREREAIGTRSKALAGVFSAVLPGAGHAYASAYKDGLLSLVVNATFGYATYEAWDAGNRTAAVVLGLFELGFYLGNIVGAVNAAHRYETDERNAWWRSLQRLEHPPKQAARAGGQVVVTVARW